MVATSEAIQGGYNDSTDVNVVGIIELSQGALCSGSLLAPNMVLTARHCVSSILNTVGGGVQCSTTTAAKPFATSGFFITTKPVMSMNPGDYVGVKEVIPAPGTDQKLCGNDQTILILARNLTPDEAVPLVPRVDSQLAKNEEYYAIGFGATNDQGAGAGQRRRRDGLFVYCAETDCKGVQDFVKPTEWIGDTGICEGDSGGPALDLQGRVVGVTSRGGQNCSSPVYGAVHGWSQWIMDTAVHAAEVGGYDAPAWATGWPTDPQYNFPIGGACDSTCASGLCLGECTRACSDLAPCPDGYDCIVYDGTNSACQAKPKPAPTPTTTTTTCSAAPGSDPTNPVPWLWGAAAVVGVVVSRRRSR